MTDKEDILDEVEDFLLPGYDTITGFRTMWCPHCGRTLIIVDDENEKEHAYHIEESGQCEMYQKELPNEDLVIFVSLMILKNSDKQLETED